MRYILMATGSEESSTEVKEKVGIWALLAPDSNSALKSRPNISLKNSTKLQPSLFIVAYQHCPSKTIYNLDSTFYMH